MTLVFLSIQTFAVDDIRCACIREAELLVILPDIILYYTANKTNFLPNCDSAVLSENPFPFRPDHIKCPMYTMRCDLCVCFVSLRKIRFSRSESVYHGILMKAA